MTRDTMENKPYQGKKTGSTGIIFQSPLIRKVGKNTVTITGR
ncbi:MAG: hypothetical protein OIN86_13600 [Candidatus Methanoperedens sp.]|nr:hypothetical protein [Candidatus Methanoperedens sp.]CAG0950612.1 hypothetical protein METP1_00177 [Methanosarcinales archaeon]